MIRQKSRWVEQACQAVKKRGKNYKTNIANNGSKGSPPGSGAGWPGAYAEMLHDFSSPNCRRRGFYRLIPLSWLALNFWSARKFGAVSK